MLQLKRQISDFHDRVSFEKIIWFHASHKTKGTGPKERYSLATDIMSSIVKRESYCENSREKRCPTQRYSPLGRFLVSKSNIRRPGKQQHQLTTDKELTDTNR